MAAARRRHAVTLGDTTGSVAMALTCGNIQTQQNGGTWRHAAARPETVLKTETPLVGRISWAF
jgi:hypothetical protein